MAARIEDIFIEQGATFNKVVYVRDESNNPVDLTGFLARGVIRNSVGGTLLATFTVTITDPDHASGAEVTINLSPSITTALTYTAYAVYDVEVYSGTAVIYRILSGRAILLPEVTT